MKKIKWKNRVGQPKIDLGKHTCVCKRESKSNIDDDFHHHYHDYYDDDDDDTYILL